MKGWFVFILVLGALAAPATPSMANCPPDGTTIVCGFGCTPTCDSSTNFSPNCVCPACSATCQANVACAQNCNNGGGTPTTCQSAGFDCDQSNTPPCYAACGASAPCGTACMNNNTRTTCGAINNCQAGPTPTPTPPSRPTPSPTSFTGVPLCGQTSCVGRCGTVACEAAAGVVYMPCGTCPTPTDLPASFPSPPPPLPANGTPMPCTLFRCDDGAGLNRCGPWQCSEADGSLDTRNCTACPVGTPAPNLGDLPDIGQIAGCPRPDLHFSANWLLSNQPFTLSVTDDGKSWTDAVFYVKAAGQVNAYYPRDPDRPNVVDLTRPYGWYLMNVVARPLNPGNFVGGADNTAHPCPTVPVNSEPIWVAVVNHVGDGAPPDGPPNCSCPSGRNPRNRDWFEPRYIANAEAGDALLLNDPGFVGGMLNAIGYHYSHAVMITSGRDTPTGSNGTTEYTARDEVTQITNALVNDFLGIPRSIDPSTLDGLKPGKWNSTFDVEQCHWHNLQLLKPADDVRSTAPRAAQNFAQRENYEGRYKISSYSNFAFDGGTQCSNAVGLAWRDTDATTIAPRDMKASDRFGAAAQVRARVRILARQAIDQRAPQGITGGVKQGWADRLADQVTNCFAGLDSGGAHCSNFSQDWSVLGKFKDAQVMGPDNLIRGNGFGNLAPYQPVDAVLSGGVYHQYLVCEAPNDPTDVVLPTCHD